MRVRLVALRSGVDAVANRGAVVDAVRDAAAVGARLVVFPEYAAAFDPRGVGPQHAEPLDGQFTAALCECTEGLTAVAGLVVPGAVPDRDRAGSTPQRDDGQDDHPAPRAINTVVAVRDGEVAGTYRKVHLYDAYGTRESDRFEAGPADAEPLVVDVDGLAVGVLTCYDLRFPESARRLVDAGATVLVVPAAWASGALKADHWLTLLRARAIENTAYVLGVPMRGPGVVGDPVVVDPRGVVVAVAPDCDVLDAELDPGLVDEVRKVNPSLANRRYSVTSR